MNLLESLNQFVNASNDIMYSYVLIIVLLGAGLFFSLITNFVQFDFKNIFASLKESRKKTGGNDREALSSREISPLQAFMVTTASRVGTGNLAGVALAITIGGPGAIFWMWITALLGGALAFAESTLAQIYKVKSPKGGSGAYFIGGPSYYITAGLRSPYLGGLFALILIFVFGFAFNAVQANTISQAFQSSMNLNANVVGLILALLSAIFIFRGLPVIAKASSFIVPIMAIIYLLLCIFVILLNITRLPEVFDMIFENAFGIREFGTGTLIGTMVTGMKRGLFSNEAGMGSAPNAAASATTSHPVKQGFIQAMGVFFDTLIICSATGFLILFSGVDFSDPNATGILLTQKALSTYFGSVGSWFMTVCIFMLAFSSILGNFFYAQNSMLFISENKTSNFIFKSAVVLSVFFGSVASFSLVWNIADLLMGIMTLINIYALFRLSHSIKEALLDYRSQERQKIDPVFHKKNALGIENVEYWD